MSVPANGSREPAGQKAQPFPDSEPFQIVLEADQVELPEALVGEMGVRVDSRITSGLYLEQKHAE